LKQAQRYFFGKESKLKSRKLIQQVFTKGKAFSVFPLKVVWLPHNPSQHLQAGVSVSSRYFKKAVDRNTIKRLMREAYRLNKNHLEESLIQYNKKLSLFIIYNAKEVVDFNIINECCKKIINRLIKEMNATH
jgi:ribonuclease P protein component